MEYGVCFGIDMPERVKIAKDSGFDYAECGFCLLSRAENSVFEAFKKALNDNEMLCKAANGFIPKDLKTTGNEVDDAKLLSYIEKGMARGADIGLKTVVFGSSGSRNVPEDTPFYDAFLQLGHFLGDIVSPLAEKYGITVVTEPLRKDETNIIHTVKEGVMLAALTGKKNVGGLADLYHMLGAGDTFDDVKQLKGCIHHAHISNPVPKGRFKRIYPADVNEFDYQGFVDALNFAGCKRCSVEANCADFAEEAPLAAKVLKQLELS